jgi:hypothetical protein
MRRNSHSLSPKSIRCTAGFAVSLGSTAIHYSEGKPEMNKQLSNYEVTFRRDPLLGWWFWTAKTPNGETLKGPLIGGCPGKGVAEHDAARRIELHAAKETVDGQALVNRVAATS